MPETDPAAADSKLNQAPVTLASAVPSAEPSAEQLAEQLVRRLAGYGSVLVAFSGGVDSTVVAAAAARGLGQQAMAVTAASPSVSSYQLDWARRCASEIGIRHQVVQTGETDRPEYQRNDTDRCYYCKQSLYGALQDVARQTGFGVIASGTNLDDLSDYRPGLRAGDEAEVVTPLADLKLGKSQVRAIAQLWGLSNHDLPAAPCLASRLAYGVSVTPARLAMIERAESWLRQQGLTDLRVRYHEGDLARIEVPLAELPRLTESAVAAELVSTFTELGFRNVTLDLAGLRSGNLNAGHSQTLSRNNIVQINVTPK